MGNVAHKINEDQSVNIVNLASDVSQLQSTVAELEESVSSSSITVQNFQATISNFGERTAIKHPHENNFKSPEIAGKYGNDFTFQIRREVAIEEVVNSVGQYLHDPFENDGPSWWILAGIPGAAGFIFDPAIAPYLALYSSSLSYRPIVFVEDSRYRVALNSTVEQLKVLPPNIAIGDTANGWERLKDIE